ncbi:11287_t:CDS:2 [Cetraspora pellucida]|uniref:11287_t:CDS:1 n=1 Tax=Cetraspora pellucida TaxID=1433469 RepID=A0ACA9NAC5_9GLOM|nr:11287_t:CDS:2 [Cetraspora pellucida]
MSTSNIMINDTSEETRFFIADTLSISLDIANMLSISFDIANTPSIPLDITDTPSISLDINDMLSFHLNTKSTSPLLSNIKNISYLLLGDDVFLDINDNENDKNKFVYDMYDLEKAIAFKFRNEEIDNQVNF